jgi:hypothetical protein
VVAGLTRRDQEPATHGIVTLRLQNLVSEEDYKKLLNDLADSPATDWTGMPLDPSTRPEAVLYISSVTEYHRSHNDDR